MADALQLSNREILKLHEGLVALDGIANKDGSVIRFRFDTKVVWNIAKNRAIIERLAETFERAKKSLGAQHSVVDRMKLTETNAPAVATFLDEAEKMLDEKQEVSGLLKLALTDLQKHDNALPPGVLTNLIPLIDA